MSDEDARSLYLAGPSAEIARVREAALVAEIRGWTITEPWWLRVEEAARNGWATDAEVPAAFMRESARRNRVGMRKAAYGVGGRFILLCRADGGLSGGGAYELGFFEQFGHRERWVVGNPRGHVGVWASRVRVVATIEEALQ